MDNSKFVTKLRSIKKYFIEKKSLFTSIIGIILDNIRHKKNV
jgi:hypothetical protein